MDIPAVSTTHADTFFGDIPCAPPALTEAQIKEAYELNTGKVIVDEFEKRGGVNPDAVPAVLVSQHGPFSWGGPTPAKQYTTPRY